MTDTKMGNYNRTVKIFSYLVSFILGVATYFFFDLATHTVLAIIFAVALAMFADFSIRGFCYRPCCNPVRLPSFFRFGGKKKTKGDDRKQD